MKEFEKKFITLPNGENYAYIEQGSGSDYLVLIHGNMSSSLFYTYLMEALPKKYHIIAPDLRGFGDSSYEHHFSSMDELADDVIMFLETLDIHKCTLTGWSAGGCVSLKVASKKPELVSKLVLLASGSYRGYPIYRKNKLNLPLVGRIYFSKEELATDPVQVAPALQATIEKNTEFFQKIYKILVFNVREPEAQDLPIFLKEIVKERCLVDLDWALTNINMSTFSNLYQQGDGTIVNVSCPTLSLWGTNDMTVREYMVDETASALANCKLVKLEGLSHSLATDDPKQIASLITSFIGE